MNETINNGGPAFPVFPETSTGHASAFRGMTLRDYFAAQVLASMIGWCQTNDGWDAENVAANAYDLADAMLRARDREVRP